MKNTLFFILLIFVLGCSKDSSSDYDSDCEIYAKVDGEELCSYQGGYYLYDEDDNYMYLQGGGGFDTFQFSIVDARKGTFKLGNNDNWAAYETGLFSTRYEAISGTLTIEKFERNTVKGRFEFVAEGYDPWEGTETKRITNGWFNLTEL